MKKLLIFTALFIVVLTAGCAPKVVETPPEPPPPRLLRRRHRRLWHRRHPLRASTGWTNGQRVSPQDVKKLMDSGAQFILVDVRTAGEYNSGYIKGAINIPVETIGNEKPAQLPDLGAPIVLLLPDRLAHRHSDPGAHSPWVYEGLRHGRH